MASIEEHTTPVNIWQNRFDGADGNIATYVNPITNVVEPYIPQGRFPHVPHICPTTCYVATIPVPWWKDMRYWVGYLSKKTLMIVLKNVLTQQQSSMEVPVEETVAEIRQRYLRLNSHAVSYTWAALKHGQEGTVFQEIDMNKTMIENGISDEQWLKETFDIPQHMYLPTVHLYWNDDLTED